jgi:hypothetical protein
MSRAPIHRLWSPEDDAALMQFVEQGKSNTTIAVRLRRSASAVAGRKKVLGLTKGPAWRGRLVTLPADTG